MWLSRGIAEAALEGEYALINAVVEREAPQYATTSVR
jgi:hypothetical protein